MQDVFVPLAAAFTLVTGAATGAFWVHRARQPIKARDARLCVLQWAVWMAIVWMRCIDRVRAPTEGLSCLASQIGALIGLVVPSQIYVVRLWRLAVVHMRMENAERAHSLSDASLQPASSASALASCLSWWRRRVTARVALVVASLVQLGLLGVCFIGADEAERVHLATGTCPFSAGAYLIYSYAIVVAVVFVTIAAASLCAVEPDNFKLVLEVRLVAVITLAVAVPATIARVFNLLGDAPSNDCAFD